MEGKEEGALDNAERDTCGNELEHLKRSSMPRNWDFKGAPDSASDCDSAYISLTSDRSFHRDWDLKGCPKLKTEQCDSGRGSMLTNIDFRKTEEPQTKPDPGHDPGCLKVGRSKFWSFTTEEASQSEPETKGRSVSLQDQSCSQKPSDVKDSRPGRSVSMNQIISFHTDWDLKKEPQVKPLSQKDLNSIFVRLEETIINFVRDELKCFYRVLASDYPECLETEEDEEQQRNRDAVLSMTLDFLRRMKQEDLVERLHSSRTSGHYQGSLKSSLQRRFSHVFEGVAKVESPALLKQIYTELYMTEGGTSEVNQEHEVKHIEAMSRKTTEITIACKDIFKGPVHRQGPIRAERADAQRPIRTVLTKGVAGAGKTVLTQKFSLDWAEGRANQDIQLLFPLTFRQLNVLRGKEFSLVGLLHHCFSETKELCGFEDLQLLFIFDGLDECSFSLDFRGSRVLTEPTESASVEELLVNLIRGSLLPLALLWITTRPAAASQIPAEYISKVTEVRGFADPQKEQYFMKKFRDELQATAVISHIKNIRTLYIMCYLPIFCWILSRVLLHLMETRESAVLPHTLTQMYIHFLVVQAKVKSLKYDSREEMDQPWTPETREMVWSLGKLAFEQLQKGNLIFYENDLSECGLDAAEIARYSGVFTEVFREESGLYQDKVFCFVHLSVQEFLAALHVHQTFYRSGVNLLRPEQTSDAQHSKELFYQSAIDLALQSPNGHWDLFLRFLLGLSLPANQSLLQGLLTQTGGAAEEAAVYLKLKMNEMDSTDRALNLFHCLHELNDRSLFDLIQSNLRSGQFSRRMSPAQWSALAFILLTSDNDLDTFDLKNFCASEEVLLRLMPVVKASNKAILTASNVAEEGCVALSKALSSESSCLKELDLSYNSLRDSGVQLLTVGLQTSHCTIHSLRLQCCCLTGDSCGPLSLVLSRSSLRLLDLSNNDLMDSGVEQLSVGLKSPLCRLQTLRLSGCMVSGKGYSALTAALKMNPSHLKDLDLSYNHPALTVKFTSSVEENPKGTLTTFRFIPCGEQFLKPGLKKYLCELTLDVNTAYRKLKLSTDNRMVMFVEEEQPYPDHLDRFDWYPQILCSSALSGRHYWEVDWSGVVSIAVSYRDISRKGSDTSNMLGQNNVSWRLWCSDGRLSVCAGNKEQYLDLPPGAAVGRVAVFLDCPAGFLSFYQVLEGRLVHLHTFHTSFTQPLFAGFGFGSRFSSATLITV